MFSKRDADKKTQQKAEEVSKAFLNDYKELVKKHHRDFDAVLDFSNPHGICARLVVIEFIPPSGFVVPEQKIVTPHG